VPDPSFVYTIYIASTPEKVWAALVEGDLTRQFWKHENVSDWEPGSRWEHVAADGPRTLKLVGRVEEVSPPRRLVLSWGEPRHADEPERHSRVSFEIEPVGAMVRLTITHDRLEAGSDMDRKIRDGWPRVLSSLKSFLETGRALDTWA